MLHMKSVLNSQRAREETIDGRRYLVAPISLINPGILNGSRGALYYPSEEVNRNVEGWDGIPLTVGHPSLNGKAVSARSPAVIERFGIGRIFNTRGGDKLRAEAWFDVEKTNKLRPDILNAVRAGKVKEISTGLFTENDPAPKGASFNGKPYNFVARSYRPDHVAVLDTKGACSVEDGCGLNVNQQTENANPTGKNQYTGKGGGGGGKAKGRRGFRVKARDPWVPDTAEQARKFLSSKPDSEHLKGMSRAHLKKIKKIATGRFEYPATNQAQASFDDLRKALRRELNTRFGQVEIVDVFPKSVVYSRLSYGPQDSDTVPRLYEVGYSADKRGKVTLSDTGATEVQRVTTYETVSNVGQLVETINANPQGCNQYGCKKGMGRKPAGKSAGSIQAPSAGAGSSGVVVADLNHSGRGYSTDEINLKGGHAGISLPARERKRLESRAATLSGLGSSDAKLKGAALGKLAAGKDLSETEYKAAVADLLNGYIASNYGGARSYASSKHRSQHTYDVLGALGIDAEANRKKYHKGQTAAQSGPLHLSTNQDGRRVGPSVFNQEEGTDMAHEPLTTNEREQLVTAMVTNCGSFGEDDREWLESLDDDRLTALAENCAEVKVLNERMAELEAEVATLNKKGAKNKGMPPWLKKKVDADTEDEGDGEDDMEENSGCSKKPTKNARADDDEEPDDEDEGCDCDDEQVTDNRNWRDLMTPAEQEVFNEGLAFRTAKREQLIKTITSNKRNRFTKEYLEEQTTNALEAIAELAAEPKGRAAPAYAGLGAPTVRMTANAEPEMEEPLGIPEPDYGAFAAAR